jgi:hypothetical protein
MYRNPESRLWNGCSKWMDTNMATFMIPKEIPGQKTGQASLVLRIVICAPVIRLLFSLLISCCEVLAGYTQ